MKLKLFQVTSVAGADMGVWDGTDADDALTAMCRGTGAHVPEAAVLWGRGEDNEPIFRAGDLLIAEVRNAAW